MQAPFLNKIAMVLCLTAAPALSSQAPVPAVAAAPTATVAAADTTVVGKVTVDGATSEVTLGDLKKRLQLLPPQIQNAPFEKIFEMLLAAEIDMRIVSSAAKKENYQEKLADRTKAAVEAVIQKGFLDDKIKTLITDADLKKFYDDVIKALPPVEEARIRQITFAEDKAAKTALADLKKGTSFDTVLEQAQKKDASVKGGDMNYVRIDDLPAPMAEKVKKAAKATTVPDVIKTEMGYHVVLVDDKRPHPAPTFEEAKPELTNMMAPKYVQQVVEGMRKTAKIEKFGLDGKPLPEAAPTAPAAATASTPAAATPAA